MEVNVKKVENGFVVTVYDDEYKDYIFPRESLVLRFLRELWKTRD